jgi:hypothetical protein
MLYARSYKWFYIAWDFSIFEQLTLRYREQSQSRDFPGNFRNIGRLQQYPLRLPSEWITSKPRLTLS